MNSDEGRLDDILGKMVTDLGAALVGASEIIRDQLGLYKTLAAGDSLTSRRLAECTGTAARSVRKWLVGQAANVLFYAASTTLCLPTRCISKTWRKDTVLCNCPMPLPANT